MEFHPNDLSDLDDLTEEHLGFSALSEGLGFSKGKKKPLDSIQPAAKAAIPRNDLSDTKKDMAFSGIGAVSAGPAMPAPSAFSKPRPQFQAKPMAQTRNTAQQAKPVAQPKAQAPVAAQVLAEPAAPRSLRLLAFVLDALILAGPLYLAWIFSFGSAAREIFLQDPFTPLALFGAIFTVYFLLSESFGGQSLAKMILGLQVVEDDKYQKPTRFRHAVARLGLFLLGIVFFGLGLIASFWDSKRRPWHDRYSGSIVRRRA